MSSLPSRVPGEQSGEIAPKLMIAIVGCLVAFFVLIIGFLLVARKTCCAARSSDPTVDQSLPSHHEHHHHHHLHRHYNRRGPLASSVRCPACAKPSRKGDEASPRVSQESRQSRAPPPPYYASRGPTAGVPRASWHAASVSLDGRASTVAAPSTTAMTPSSSPPPPAYATRGPTASLPVRRAT